MIENANISNKSLSGELFFNSHVIVHVQFLARLKLTGSPTGYEGLSWFLRIIFPFAFQEEVFMFVRLNFDSVHDICDGFVSIALLHMQVCPVLVVHMIVRI